ncbi:unnamed protein product [Rhodiola kirilowii]
MSKLVILFALLLPALAAARHVATTSTKQPLTLSGRTYCDTCQAGFVTPATTYIQGAKVKIQCTSRKTQQVTWTSEEVETDSTGTYHINIDEEHENETCDVLLVSSPVSGCSEIDPALNRVRVTLFRNNGIVGNDRMANSMGFKSADTLAACDQVMEQYKITDEDV